MASTGACAFYAETANVLTSAPLRPRLMPLASEVAQFGAQVVEIARAPVDFAPRPDGEAGRRLAAARPIIAKRRTSGRGPRERPRSARAARPVFRRSHTPAIR